MPSSISNVDASSTILTGSSDGLVRAVQVLPTRLLGVVADHGEWPIERIAIGGGTEQLTLEHKEEVESGSKAGETLRSVDVDEEAEAEEGAARTPGRWWVGSVGHEDVLRMTDLEEALFRAGEEGKDGLGEPEASLGVDGSEDDSDVDVDDDEPMAVAPGPAEEDEDESDSGEDEDELKVKKRKRKPEKDPLVVKKKKGKNEVEIEGAFFDDL